MNELLSRRRLIQSGVVVAASSVIASPNRMSAQSEATPSPTALVWRDIAPMPNGRSEMPGVAIGGSLFICGGFGGEQQVTRYDEKSDSWTQLAELPVGANHPGVAALDGKVYVAGGYSGSALEAVDHLWVYDPAVNTWQPGAALPQPVGALGLVAAAGKLYAVGGALQGLGGPVSRAVNVYDPGSDAWSTGPDMLTSREHLAVVANMNKIYAVGGRANGSEDDRFAAANEVLDLATGQWNALSPLPVPRGGLAGTSAMDTVIVMGGERGDKAFDDVNQYDPTTDQWSALPKLTVARHGMTTAVIGKNLYAIAGSTRARSAENTAACQAMILAE